MHAYGEGCIFVTGLADCPVTPDLVRGPAARRLPGQRLFSARGLGLAGCRVKPGM